MEWLWFVFGAVAMLVFLGGWAYLDDWLLEQRIKAREEAFLRERKERQERFEKAAAIAPRDQGDLFAGWGKDEGAGQ